MKEHVKKRQLNSNISQTKRMLYNNIDDIIQSRVKAAAMNLGNKQTISKEAATELVQRSIRNIGGGYQLTQDIRLEWPLMFELTSEQVSNINTTLGNSSCCDVAIYYAENGWPYTKEYTDTEIEQLKPKINKTLKGSHHFHADPDTATNVTDEIYSFIIQ